MWVPCVLDLHGQYVNLLDSKLTPRKSQSPSNLQAYEFVTSFLSLCSVEIITCDKNIKHKIYSWQKVSIQYNIFLVLYSKVNLQNSLILQWWNFILFSHGFFNFFFAQTLQPWFSSIPKLDCFRLYIGEYYLCFKFWLTLVAIMFSTQLTGLSYPRASETVYIYLARP